jgi:hypothetical protein
MIKTLTGVKAIAVVFFFSLILVHPSFSQIKIGAKLGPTLANINGGNASHNNRFRLGGHIGAYGNYNFADKMGIQLELLFTQKGTINRNIPNSWVRINYLDIPVLFTYLFTDEFSAHIGLELSTALSAFSDEDGRSRRFFIHDIHQGTISLPLGATYEIENGLNVGLRADIGLSAIGNDGARNNVFLLSLGYTFFKNGSGGSTSSGKSKK